jgi:hypothetical protein
MYLSSSIRRPQIDSLSTHRRDTERSRAMSAGQTGSRGEGVHRVVITIKGRRDYWFFGTFFVDGRSLM